MSKEIKPFNDTTQVVSEHRGESDMTYEHFREMAPRNAGRSLIQEAYKMLKDMQNKTGFEQSDMEYQFSAGVHIMQQFDINLKMYIDAVTFVALTRHYSLAESWKKTFPNKYAKVLEQQKLYDEEKTDKPPLDIEGAAKRFNNKDYVVALKKQSLIPDYIHYSSEHHKMMQHLKNLAMGIVPEGVKPNMVAMVQATTKFLEYTTLPEEQKFLLEHKLDDTSKNLLSDLNKTLAKNAELQLQQLAAGKSLNEAQRLNLISEEIVDAQIE